MPGDAPVRVVVAAGGLGTRVHPWARYIPKEFFPVEGRPGITHLLDEIAALGPAHVVIVYHPYYEQFAAWARQVLSQHGHARYARAARREVPAAVPPRLSVSFTAQHGPYADLTSVLNGADHLAADGDLYVAFADNLYPGARQLPVLRATPPGYVAALASRYQPHLAGSRGILVTSPYPGSPLIRTVSQLTEKPTAAQAAQMEEKHGAANLLMLEGRARLTPAFVAFARTWQQAVLRGTEPKLSLAIGAYACSRLVLAVRTGTTIIDPGTLASLTTQPTPQSSRRRAPGARYLRERQRDRPVFRGCDDR